MTESSTIRVALVLNGGVSLAVWMGDVTHELDRLRRNASPAWLAVTEACGKEVVVDLVAGTSAGGLNGSLLASAIASGAQLPDLLDIWRERGKLIRPRLLHDEPGQATNSVLEGDFFYDEIEEVLSGLEPVVEPQDVTLLVTSTALYGSSAETRDVRGFRSGPGTTAGSTGSDAGRTRTNARSRVSSRRSRRTTSTPRCLPRRRGRRPDSRSPSSPGRRRTSSVNSTESARKGAGPGSSTGARWTTPRSARS